jgi:hypothetical protein
MKITNMRNSFPLILVAWLFVITSFAQIPKLERLTKVVKDSVALKLDSSKNEVRNFDRQAIDRYKNEKEFQYGEVDAQKLNWWQRFWKNFWAWIDRLFGEREVGAKKRSVWPAVLRYGAIAITIAMVIFVVFKLIGVDWRMLSKKSKDIEVPYDESLENIHEISFEDELAVATQNQNYRLAVRLLYLQTLKHLSDKGLIDWHLNKTNAAYVAEVKQNIGNEHFENLTYQFEYVWYGDFGINQPTYEIIKQSFEQFKDQVK